MYILSYSARNNTLTPFFPVCIHLISSSCLIALTKTSCIILNQNHHLMRWLFFLFQIVYIMFTLIYLYVEPSPHLSLACDRVFPPPPHISTSNSLPPASSFLGASIIHKIGATSSTQAKQGSLLLHMCLGHGPAHICSLVGGFVLSQKARRINGNMLLQGVRGHL